MIILHHSKFTTRFQYPERDPRLSPKNIDDEVFYRILRPVDVDIVLVRQFILNTIRISLDIVDENMVRSLLGGLMV